MGMNQPNEKRPPDSRPNNYDQTRRSSTPPGRKSQSVRSEIGRPPVIPLSAFLICEITPIFTIAVGSSSRSVPLLLLGFFLGTFAGVLAFAWFVIRDNEQQSKMYRDWGILSPRESSKWVLFGGWLVGLANMFLAAIEFSRSIAGIS